MVCTRSVNAVSRPGNTMVQPVSGGLAVLEHDLELSQNHVPISTSGGPVFDDFPAGQIEHLSQGIIVGEAGLVLGNLAELAVQALNDIGRVYDFPNLRGICEKGAQNIPIILPAFHTGGILISPLFFECHQGFQGFILSDGGVDFFQIRHQRLDVLIAYKTGGGADLMDNAPLHLAVGIHRRDGLHEALQAIHTEQIYVQNSPAFEVVQHIQPEFAALVLPDPHTQDVLCAVHGNAQNHVCRLRLILVVFFYLVVDGIQKHKRIHRFQG